VDRSDVLSLYLEGVTTVQSVVQGWPAERWKQPACGRWTALDVAGHLLCVARWYHHWLDRAESGDARPPFAAQELAERNGQALVGLRPTDGADRVALFVEEAERYAERLDSSWALPYGFPHGTVPAGAHAAVAALEWHLHAWDLAAGRHRPADPRMLLTAASRAMGAARRGPRARLGAAAAPLLAGPRPWEWTLRRSGRVLREAPRTPQFDRPRYPGAP
jgi:uncharacterized protein (TIGR03083 family)